MTEFKVPELGENVAGGDVTRVLVNVGDSITKDQTVLELETDKATIEVPSSVAGVIKEIKVKQGDKVKVGAVVLTVDEAASGSGAGAAAPARAGAAPPPAPAAAPNPTKAPEPAKPTESAPAPAAETRDHKDRKSTRLNSSHVSESRMPS